MELSYEMIIGKQTIQIFALQTELAQLQAELDELKASLAAVEKEVENGSSVNGTVEARL